jgi:hypothetical protein
MAAFAPQSLEMEREIGVGDASHNCNSSPLSAACQRKQGKPAKLFAWGKLDFGLPRQRVDATRIAGTIVSVVPTRPATPTDPASAAGVRHATIGSKPHAIATH